MILMQYTGIVLLFRHMKPTTFCWRVILSATQLNQCEVDAVLREVGSPEAINNRPETAPSKRLEKWTGNCYRKTVQGVTIAQKCGVDVMRRQCPNFNSWISKIESLCS